MTVMIAVVIVGLVCGYILASFLPARITALAWVVLLSVNTASLLETRDMFRAASPEEFPGLGAIIAVAGFLWPFSAGFVLGGLGGMARRRWR
jgi:uncharacterized membrane protein YfcA